MVNFRLDRKINVPADVVDNQETIFGLSTSELDPLLAWQVVLSFNQYHHCIRPDPVKLHCGGARFTFQDRLKRIHVGDIHRQSNSVPVSWMDESADIFGYAREHFFSFRR
jgi:hypothetical protein